MSVCVCAMCVHMYVHMCVGTHGGQLDPQNWSYRHLMYVLGTELWSSAGEHRLATGPSL